MTRRPSNHLNALMPRPPRARRFRWHSVAESQRLSTARGRRSMTQCFSKEEGGAMRVFETWRGSAALRHGHSIRRSEKKSSQWWVGRGVSEPRTEWAGTVLWDLLALVFAAACGGKVVFVTEANGGLGGAGGQGGAPQTPSSTTIAVTNAATTTGMDCSSLPAPPQMPLFCSSTASGGSCVLNYCDGAKVWSASCQGGFCTCTYTDANQPEETTSCSCTGLGDACSGAPTSGAPSCCLYAQ